MELRGHSRITDGTAGGRRAAGTRPASDMDLKYGADGQTLERAVDQGRRRDRARRASAAGAAGRQIRANTIDITLAPDGATPTALAAREAVALTLPAAGRRARTNDSIVGNGRPGRAGARADAGAVYGRTSSSASGARTSIASRGRERSTWRWQPAMAGIEDATFTQRRALLRGWAAGESPTTCVRAGPFVPVSDVRGLDSLRSGQGTRWR